MKLVYIYRVKDILIDITSEGGIDMERQETHCIICGEVTNDGIIVVNQFICILCEQEMVNTDVQDTKYSFFIHQLRQLWLHSSA